MTYEPQALGEIRHWVQVMGWKVQATPYKSDYQVKAWRRQGENLMLIWRAKLFAPAESWFTSPDVDGQLTVPDAAAAVSVLRTHVPTYDFTAWADEAVLKYLKGKQIQWVNAMTGEQDTATVPDASSTVLGRSRMRRRHITFAQTSYQSVGLDAIIDIR